MCGIVLRVFVNQWNHLPGLFLPFSMRGRLGRLALRAGRVFAAVVPILVLVSVMTATLPLFAQEAGVSVSLLKSADRSTPQAWSASFDAEAKTLHDLLKTYMRDPTTANVQAYLNQLKVLRDFFELDAVPAAFRTAVGNEAIAELIDILNRLPASQLSADAVNDGSMVDQRRWAIPGTEIVLVRRAEGADEGNFVIQSEVIAKLPGYHDQIMPLPLLRETDFSDMRSVQANLTGPFFPRPVAVALSSWLDAPMLGVPSWKLVVAFLALLLTLGANVIASRLIRLTERRKSKVGIAFLKLLGPLLLAVSFVALSLFCQAQLMIQGYATLVVLLVRNLCQIIAAAWAVLSLANLITEFLIGSEMFPDQKMDAHLTRLIGKTVGIFGAIAVVVFGLGTVGVPTAGIITSLGIGGVGLAFATRVTMENLFGGFVLLIDRPFRIGDHIKIISGEGIVTEIGARSCRIETLEGNTLTIPNGALSASAITRIQAAPADSP